MSPYLSINQSLLMKKFALNETNKEAVHQFYNYLYSQQAKNILKRFGYIVN